MREEEIQRVTEAMKTPWMGVGYLFSSPRRRSRGMRRSVREACGLQTLREGMLSPARRCESAKPMNETSREVEWEGRMPGRGMRPLSTSRKT